MAVEVVLNVFSGRPNPRWRLDEEQARELDQLLGSLETLPEGKAERKLGYRGFLILNEPKPENGPVEKARIFHGVVERPEGALLDRDRSLERWLLESAGPALPPELHNLVQRELEK
jgi:hypothetical protein